VRPLRCFGYLVERVRKISARNGGVSSVVSVSRGDILRCVHELQPPDGDHVGYSGRISNYEFLVSVSLGRGARAFSSRRKVFEGSLIRLPPDCNLIGSDCREQTNVSQIVSAISKSIGSTNRSETRQSAHISDGSGRRLSNDQISNSIIQCNSKRGKSRGVSPDMGRMPGDTHGHSTSLSRPHNPEAVSVILELTFEAENNLESNSSGITNCGVTDQGLWFANVESGRFRSWVPRSDSWEGTAAARSRSNRGILPQRVPSFPDDS
jgi:hypothetical protein